MRLPRLGADPSSPFPPLEAALHEAGLVTAPADAPVAELFRLAGLVAGRGEARRVVAEGGAYLNNERVTQADEPVPADRLLHGRYLVVRVEHWTRNTVLRGITRVALNPSRSLSNITQGRMPWFRAMRPLQ